MLVQGPYLVRSAALDDDRETLALSGDIDADTEVSVFALDSVKKITWNGRSACFTAGPGRSRVFVVHGPGEIEIPSLGPWKVEDALPEVGSKYDTSSEAWIGMYLEMARYVSWY